MYFSDSECVNSAQTHLKCRQGYELTYWANILRGPYLCAGEFNPVLKPVCLSHSRGGSNSQLAKSTLRGYLRYPPLNLAFISFQKNQIELPCKEINASSYAAPVYVARRCTVCRAHFPVWNSNGGVWVKNDLPAGCPTLFNLVVPTPK